MSTTIRIGLFCALILLLGCPAEDDDDDADDDTGDDDTGDDDTGDDDTGDDDTGDDDTGDDDTWTPGGCGAPAYQWLPSADMGEIVQWEDGGTFTNLEIAYAEAMAGFVLGTPPTHGVHLYVIRYVTQDRGVQVEATASLAFPVFEQETAVPSLLYFHGTTGYTDACAPSTLGADYGENIYAASHAARGFAVAVPDYLGMNGLGAPSESLHPYGIPEPTAVASLDALRALHRFTNGEGDTDLMAVPEARTVMLGVSQGGGAVLVSERYAPHYAPEFDIVAGAAHVPNSGTLEYLAYAFTEPDHNNGAGVPWFAAAWDWYGQQGSLDEVLTDDAPLQLASTTVGLMQSSCDYGTFWDLSATDAYQQTLIDAVTGGDLSTIEPWGCMLEQSTLSLSEVPRASDTPMLYQVSGEDGVLFPAAQQAEFEALCAQGYEMNYLVCDGLDHVEGVVASMPHAHAWLNDRLAGTALTDPCVVTAPIDCTAE